MRKLHIVLLGIFVAGILLGGIGAGVTFVEYSEFEYSGKVSLGEENLVTKELDYKFTPSTNEQIRLNYCYWGDRKRDTLIVQDESIPVGVIRYRVTYNETMVNPSLLHWSIEHVEEQEAILEHRTQKVTSQEELDNEDIKEVVQVTVPQELSEQDSEREKRKEIVLQLENNYLGGEFSLIMENKDKILEELKQKKIASYEIVTVKDVEILVNPQSMLYIDDCTR